jgi:serine/threonine protein kinase
VRLLKSEQRRTVYSQMVSYIESIHALGYLHANVKPQQFKVKEGNLYLLDFGQARPYMKEDRSHVDQRLNLQSKPRNHPNFSSLNAQLGKDTSRRDDLESLGYVFAHLEA